MTVKEIEVKACEVGICEGVGEVGTQNLLPVMCSLREPCIAMVVEVSHEDVTTGV